MKLEEIVQATSVMPVMVIDRVEDAVPLAKALVEGGIRVLEITLRTEAGLQAVKLIKQEVPDAIVGVGTISSPRLLEASIEAGAAFGVSPGTPPTLLKAIVESGLPFFPGVATMTEVMQVMDAGLTVMKFFPAVAAGGVKMLESFAGPFPKVQFCPTGGISAANAPEFFRVKNVVCVGGSWLTPRNLVMEGNWAAITQLAREAQALKP